jgi:hypothetical protein
MTNVNSTLTLAKSDVHISRITWSLARNYILLVCEGHTVIDLKPLTKSITHLLTKQPQQINSISEDKLWPQVVIDGVATGILPWDKTPSPHSMEHILDTICTDNPWFENIKLKELLRWICGHKSINTKKHSSLVLMLKSESSQKELLNHRFIFGWGHPMCIKEYLYTKPTQQCLKSWSLTHNMSACNTQYKCR